MDTSGVTQLVVILFLILLAAFFSSAESAFSSVNKLRIKSLAEEGNNKALKVYDLLEHPSRLLSSVLIANIILVIAAATITTLFAIEHLGSSYILPSLFVLTILVLIIGEITPKFIANAYPESIAMAYVNIISLFTKIMLPFTFVFNGTARGLLKLFNVDLEKETFTITEDELLTIIDESHEEGIIESEERKMIANVVEFGDSYTKDVMVPRSDIVFGSDTMTYEELVEIFSIHKYTRIPIYSESRDNIVGILNLKDLFFNVKDPSEFSIEEIMREPFFTYEYKRTFELFTEMKTNSITIAIVLDEYGETAGLVTLEDLIEEIVGEIRDEYDEDEEDAIQVIGDNEYLIDGSTIVDEINETLGIELEPIEYENIAGHMIYLFDHLPEEGETVVEQNVLLTVDTIVKNRIEKVRLKILPEDTELEDLVETSSNFIIKSDTNETTHMDEDNISNNISDSDLS
ncbi:MAG: HlyC/CorC family transporter [Clostridiales bacterium]|nr:HlyC/CorC family transporter [Clostridiales bacterium]